MQFEQINKDHIILTILGLLLTYLPWLFLRIKTGCKNGIMKMDLYSIFNCTVFPALGRVGSRDT